jgi:hypothetical protein
MPHPAPVGRLLRHRADRHPARDHEHRIAQQVGASFGVAIVAVVLQSLLAHGAVSAFHTAFWWAVGITVAAR